MEPTWELVQKCYKSSREFFKDGAKADNKRYDDSIDLKKSVEAGHRIDASDALASIRQQNVPYVTMGQLLRETGNMRGNCGEMTAVAAAYVAG
ncbi:MAG: hypothetical protein ABW106_13380 [Steroidobacteraceae bacterium]